MDFVHLHVHTEYSLADATNKIKDLTEKAAQMGMKALAITDHGAMFGVIDFYKACVKNKIKPILGMETYVAPRTNTLKEANIDNANYHLVLLCENNTGYQNLIKIASDASIHGFYYKPRTDKRTLEQHHEGLIALSACLGGEVQKLLLQEEDQKAKEVALEYQRIFGVGNFYLELQNHNLPEQVIVNTKLIRMSRETGIPLICTNDTHYIDKSGAKAHDVLMAVQAKTTIFDEKRKKYTGDQWYFKSQSEMYQLFGYIPSAIENTVKVADRCNVTIEFGKNKLPKFAVPEGYTSHSYLLELIYKGAEMLYPEMTPEIDSRIRFEFDVISNMGYVDYFLIVWDFFRYCWEKGILTGPGRGSAGGSIIAYCLGITKIDPLRYNLLFERFLDPSRISMPDIDSDFQDDRRQEVIDYVVQKYGRKSIAQIITFGTMAARSAIRAVGRALDFPYATQDMLAKMVPIEVGITLKAALVINTDLKFKYDTDENIRMLLDTAMALEGLPLYTGTHAAGVLITDDKGVNAHVPTWDNDGAIVCQYEMGFLEDLGLLKMDFLGLKTLTVISRAIAHIRKNYGTNINLEELYQCPDDRVLQLIGDGNTQGIFQLESGGMTQFMVELKPKNVEEIIAGISLYRPGPIQYIPKFLENRRNVNSIAYDFEELRPILNETYGVLCYQEQCMRTVIAIAGYQRHHSDSFRKAISKKKADLIAQHRTWFIDGRPEIKDENGKVIQDAIPGGVAMGHPREKLEKLYNEMEEFGRYCFNKSHAAAYAVLAYVTCWQKFYYPTEFMAALMDSVNKKKQQVARYIQHCKKDLNIEILPPDINNSSEYFIPLKNRSIIYSLSAKNTNEEMLGLIRAVREEAPIKSVFDFFIRCSNSINKQTFEALISIGAFDSLGIVRSQYLAGLDDIIKKLQSVKNSRKRAMESSLKPTKKARKEFNFEERFKISEFIPDIKEFPDDIKLKLEKKYLGLYLSGHPLYKYLYAIQNNSNFKTSDIDYDVDEDTGDVIMLNDTVRNGQPVRFIGIVNEIKEVVTKKRDQMAIVDIEDLHGNCKLVIFPMAYKRVKAILKEDEIYKIDGMVSIKQDESPAVFCDSMDSISATLIRRLIINIDSPKEGAAISEYIKRLGVQGGNPVYLIHDSLKLLLKRELWIDIDLFLEYFDRDVLPQKKIEIKEW